MPTETGIYTESDVEIGHLHSEKLAQKILDLFDRDKWVIDFGCGRGDYVKHLIDRGYNSIGIDGINIQNLSYIKTGDLTNNIELGIKGNVMSLEVGEHIPEMYESQFIQNIINHCDSKLLLSWAVLNQPGIGHINCRDNIYIINRLSDYGFAVDEDITKWLRSDIEPQLSYFENTLMYFTR